jgi:hypothetical protein
MVNKRSECLLCFLEVNFFLLSNSSNLCISSLRLISGFFNTPLWLFTLSDTSAEITSLAQSVAQRLYDGGNGAINAEVTGRTTQIEVNADGTKTMPLNQNDRSPIRILVLYEKHEKYQEW